MPRRHLAALIAAVLVPLPLYASEPAQVVATYADIAAVTYGDSLITAQA